MRRRRKEGRIGTAAPVVARGRFELTMVMGRPRTAVAMEDSPLAREAAEDGGAARKIRGCWPQQRRPWKEEEEATATLMAARGWNGRSSAELKEGE
ncbi:CREB-regulated transcription coactivator 3 [Sesbania bispinosa]|nr:CREB-regulated transcription coactivator 3 [Sesbania bispinosa]